MKLMKDVELKISQIEKIEKILGHRVTGGMDVSDIRDRLENEMNILYADAKDAEDLCIILNRALY